jgi:glutamate formiminotransferase/formiminotetrahydrofolate cyclodeaminase
VVGLVCQDALIDAAEHYLRLESFSRDQILENRLARHIGAAEQSVPEFAGQVAGATPTPGGGSVAAVAGGLAAALAAMVARLTIGKAKYAEHEGAMRHVEERAEGLRQALLELADEDTRAYDAFVNARRMSQRTPEEIAARARALADAALRAASTPLATAEACVEVLELALTVASHGNVNAVSDAGVAAWLARSGVEGGVLNVRINLGSVPESERAGLEERSRRAAERATGLHAECVGQVAQRMAASA